MPKYALSCVETCSARTEYYAVEADSLEEALLMVASGDEPMDERRNCEFDHWDYLLDAQEDDEPVSAERQKAADEHVRRELKNKTAPAADAAIASLAELIEICRWKCSPLDEVILASGRTNHQALLDAVKVHARLTE